MGKDRDRMREKIMRDNAHLIDMFAREERPVGSVYGLDATKANITVQSFASTVGSSGVVVSGEETGCFSHAL